MESQTNAIYFDNFIPKVAAGRNMSAEQANTLGQGRVWTGSQALERGLVDRTGLLADAIASAAKRAKLGDDPTVRYVEPDRSTFDRLLSSMGDAAAPSLRGMVMHALGGIPAVPAPLREAQVDITWLAEQAEAGPAGSKPPVRAIVHCLCTAP